MWFCQLLCFENNLLFVDINCADSESRIALVLNRLEGNLKKEYFHFDSLRSSINRHIDALRFDSLFFAKPKFQRRFRLHDQPHFTFLSTRWWTRLFSHPFCIRKNVTKFAYWWPKKGPKATGMTKFQHNLFATIYTCSFLYFEVHWIICKKRIVIQKWRYLVSKCDGSFDGF